MADVKPLKLVDHGDGAGRLEEFGAGDRVPAENLPATEWAAETVPQAEAEAGAATTRRAWTAQRVRQAIVAWWNGSDAKTQLDAASSGITSLQASKLDATANAVSAGKLATARTIGGVAFDGTANITLPGVNAVGNQSTTGNAATATALQTARTINGVSFNGTANITVADATKQAAHANLSALSGLTGAADRLPYFTGAGALSLATLTGLARDLLDDTTQSGMQSTLGLVKQTSATDTTAGALMAVGAFGLGAILGSVSDFNAAMTTGIYGVNTSGVLNAPTASYSASTLYHRVYDSNVTTQLLIQREDGGFWTRVKSNNIWQAWRRLYDTGNILGTVSQSGGVPTGAIIERGSNANGEYTYYADGTAIVSGPYNPGSLSWATATAVRYAQGANITLPASIIAGGRAIIMINNNDIASLSAYCSLTTLGTTTITDIYLTAPHGTTGATVSVPGAFLVHGRWY